MVEQALKQIQKEDEDARHLDRRPLPARSGRGRKQGGQSLGYLRKAQLGLGKLRRCRALRLYDRASYRRRPSCSAELR